MIKLTIFSRLVISYTIILVLPATITYYAISQIGEFNNLTYKVLLENNDITDYKEKLIYSLLSQMRYEERYIISKDKTLYDLFLLAKDDFSKYLKEFTIRIYPRGENKLEKIENYYKDYQSLIDKEINTKSNQPYSQDSYKKEKEKAVDGIIEELKKLEGYREKDTFKKIIELEKVGANARFITSIMSFVAIFIGFLFSLSITRSITKPIAVIKEKTREIAKGNFGDNLNLSYLPEIGELANSINLMSNKLKELDKVKSDFFSNISHELRTPLTSIKEGISLFRESTGENLTDKQKMLLRIIAEASNRLIGLVNSILDLSKIEAGMMAFNYTRTDIIPLINNAVLETEPLAIVKNINIKVEAAQNLPMVKMDQEKILQVLLNLIGNAVKFTPANGHVDISVRQTNGNLQVSVKDTGPGIENEKLVTIFERFQQISTKGSHSVNGTGLGLAIVKHIITRHGGKVWAESNVREGSLFAFTLPL